MTIIQIDTATEKAQVGIARDGRLLQALWNHSQKDHAAFLQVSVAELARQQDVKLTDIDAIAVTMGPGSYTGLRVGMASAKGLCYVLNKPLITVNTLEVMALSAMLQAGSDKEEALFCPMIDARRMEVFTALYDKNRVPVLEPCALILDAASFAAALEKGPVIFSGNGAAKFAAICESPNAQFYDLSVTAEAMAQCAAAFFSEKKFADLAYAEPLYIKEFQDISAR